MASAKVAADLAASLATIAIASLGGPMAAGGVALGQVVKHAQAAYMANVETRDLRRRVSSVIASWAVSEGLNAEVEPGMALAARVLSEHGLTTAGLARLDFDADRITRRVVTAARAADKAAAQKNDQPSYWDTEPHYAVATRVVRVTYDALTRQLQAGDQVLLAAIAAVRHDIDGHVVRLRESGQRIEASLTELLAALVAAASAADVMSYLRARLSDWDVSVWHPDRQALSTLERRLQVQASHASEHHRGELTADEALQGTRMLIVLGGPGSGKTWQAYRYARQAARLALSRLEEGAGLEEVEIPLYTTWDHWVKTGGNGGTRESLVTASLSSGLGHTDPERVESLARLSRTLGQATTKVLFVVDSLDEAADLTRQDARLRELSGAISCRVVVTSRPAAWAAARRATASGPDEALVVDLMPLEYPKDVEGFVRAWFDHDPGRATALLGQMRDRDDLQQAAVVPLLLTFYCLITEVADDANAPLPARRRLLFRRLVKRLLRSAWTMDGPGIDAAPDDDQCSEVLSRWAWSAVRDRVTATGLGNWGDSFTQPESLPPTIARPIDHVAPKVAVDGEGGITRRFVHRTLLEHFVAEHMASLAVGEAAEQLLPHLWFDPDWQVALPAAVAAHPLCGELLRQLRDVAETPARDAARRTAAIQIDEMLLAIAVESEPDDWPAAESAAIHQCRIRNAVARPSHLARSAHWTSSNAEARAALLGALPGADLLAVRELTTVLQALGAPRSERAEARATVLAALPDTPAWALDGLLSVLEGLRPTEAERAQARTTVLKNLASADSLTLRDLAAALPRLGPTEAERSQARATVLRNVPRANPLILRNLVASLPGLGPTKAERAEARDAVLAALHDAAPWAIQILLAVLPGLVPTAAERAEARAPLLAALSGADPLTIRNVVAVLPSLEPTATERAKARVAVLAVLPGANPSTVPDFVSALPALGMTAAERAEARSAVLAALPGTNLQTFRRLVAALPALEPTEAERAEACAAVLAALANADARAVRGLVVVLQGLGLTEAERAEARATVRARLSAPQAWVSEGLLVVLEGLGLTEAERAATRGAVLATLSGADLLIMDLVAALLRLGATQTERAKARAAVLDALADADANAVWGLVAALARIGPTEAERAEARAALVTALPAVDPWAIRSSVAVLLGLGLTETERAAARSAVLANLGQARDYAIENVTQALRMLSSVAEWLEWLRFTPPASPDRSAVDP